MEHFIQKLSDLHHVYHWRRLVGLREVDLVEVINIATLGLVNKKMVQGIPIDQIRTHHPNGIEPRHVLHQGGEWSALNDMPVQSCRDHQIFILPPRMTCMSRVLGIGGMVTLECRSHISIGRFI